MNKTYLHILFVYERTNIIGMEYANTFNKTEKTGTNVKKTNIFILTRVIDGKNIVSGTTLY